jgi:transposase
MREYILNRELKYTPRSPARTASPTPDGASGPSPADPPPVRVDPRETERQVAEIMAAAAPQSAPPSPAAPGRAEAPGSRAATIVLPATCPLPGPVPPGDRPVIYLGLDVHLEFIMAVAQRGHLPPEAPRKLTADQLVALVERWVREGHAVYSVQESCGFGFVLHRRLEAAGAQSFVITPIALNGRRKTDKLDARALCVRLARYVDGNAAELRPIRIPTEAEQQRREGPRRRQFLKREIRRLANRGHAQAAEYLFQPLPRGWWRPRKWPKLEGTLEPWLRSVLTGLRELIVAVERQVEVLESELLGRVAGQERPKGLGEPTLVALEAEVCDWNRFRNRKQVGSYTGCCPGEHSSGGVRRVGPIDRIGNGRVRTLLVEAVWRFLQWQPTWKAAARLKVKLASGAALKKKTVIALARQLAIDLWRWRTGRCTLADLGWVAL